MNQSSRRFSKQSLKIFFSFLVIYLLWLFIGIGFRNDHYYFIAIFTIGYFLNEKSHKMTFGLIFFIFFWILYDTLRIVPNYELNPIHVKELYDLEKSLFGVFSGGELLTLNEYFDQYSHKILDFLAGVFYLLWIPAPLIYAIILFFTDKKMLIRFSSAFLLANIIGFTIYYLYPAAPPWYVEYYGFEENFSIPGNPANLIKFDQMTGISIFENMYNKNSNVFAAVPSLHAAYPLILFFYGIKKKYWLLSILFFLIMTGIWFAAVYSFHHYLIDVILGIICAIFAILLVEKFIVRTRLNRYIEQFADYIS